MNGSLLSRPSAVIILAAGFSSRMGRFKPLIRLGSRTITDRLIENYRAQNIATCLVTGWNGPALEESLTAAPDWIIPNPDYAGGMFTSVLAGWKALSDQAFKHIFIQPVDIPLIRSFTLRRLLSQSAESPRSLIYPVFKGKRGHPPLIPSTCLQGVVGWPGEGGLKGYLESCQCPVKEAAVPDANILFDIDTPADLPELEERYRSYARPSQAECEVILDDICNVSTAVRRHCLEVARLAGLFSQALQQSGWDVDPELVRSAAVLHDICKGRPDHERAAAEVLAEMGFSETAEIVAGHTEMGTAPSIRLETKIVFLADKFIREDRRVNLDDRYQAARQKFGHLPAALAGIERRRAEAFSVKAEFESQLGYSLEKLVFEK